MIRIWPDIEGEQIEHLATRAAELGDVETEQLCDRALDRPTLTSEPLTPAEASAILLADLLAYDGDLNQRYAEWMELGHRDGYRKRPPEVA